MEPPLGTLQMAKGLSLAREQQGSGPGMGKTMGEGLLRWSWVYFYHKKRSAFKTARDKEHSALITQFQQLSTHDQLCFISVTIDSPSIILKPIPDTITF